MSRGKQNLRQLELVVLLAVARLEDQGYGEGIRREIAERSGRRVSRGAVYVTLERLRDKGYLSSWMGDPSPVRGGRARRYYRVEPAGREAAAESLAVLARLQEGLELAPGRRR